MGITSHNFHSFSTQSFRVTTCLYLYRRHTVILMAAASNLENAGFWFCHCSVPLGDSVTRAPQTLAPVAKIPATRRVSSLFVIPDITQQWKSRSEDNMASWPLQPSYCHCPHCVKTDSQECQDCPRLLWVRPVPYPHDHIPSLSPQ